MIRLWNKIRDWALLFGLLFISTVVLLSVNEPMLTGLRARALETTGSVETWFAWMGNYVRAIEENQTLREENFQLSSELALAREAQTENDRLRNLLAFGKSSEFSLIPAQIVSKDVTRERNYLVIDVGSDDGVEEGMAVVEPRGILGKTVLVGRRFTRVMSYLNSEFFTPVKILPSESDGLIRWDGERHDRLLLEHVVRSQEVIPGQIVVTSGYSGVFQPGFLIGKIDSVFVRPGMTTWQIYVTPLARLDDATHAFVILSRPDPERMEVDS